MFEAASFSLCSLFVFCPLVRGGEGAEKSSESEVPFDDGIKDAGPTWAGVSQTKSMGSFFEPGEAGFAETCLAASKEPMGSRIPCFGTSTTSGYFASSSWRTSKLFLFSDHGVSARGECS